MPAAPKKLVAAPGGMVTLTALKWSGTATTVGSLVAATRVRVIAGEAGVVCAAAGPARAAVPRSTIPIALKYIITSKSKLVRPCRCAKGPDPVTYHDYGPR